MGKMERRLMTFTLIAFNLFSFASVAKDKKQTSSTVLQTTMGKLTYSTNGLQLETNGKCPSSVATGDALWFVVLQNLSDNTKEVVISDKENVPEIDATANGFRLVYNQLVLDGKTWNVKVELDFSVQDGAFQVSGTIHNQVNDWVVMKFIGPVLNGINANLSSFPLLMPCGLGQKFIKEPSAENPINKVTMKGALAWKYNKAVSAYEMTAEYPCRFATMQWCAMAGENGGLYFASHDKEFGSKQFRVRYQPEAKTFGLAFMHDLTCFAGQSWSIPPQIIMPYAGTWHKGADYYRAWYNTATWLQEVPVWAQNSSGWMLTILKQQNDEIMWNYGDLAELNRLSTERGLDLIGLFGWTAGGHDRFYPYYDPDSAMGGREALVKALSDIRKSGKRSILYANGQLIDQHGTDYWDKTGKSITVLKKDGTLDYEKWHKYTDAPARYHGLACLGTGEWYQRMLSLAMQANELGADGILYDQLAVRPPKICYSPDHGHSVPAIVYAKDRCRLLDCITSYMKTINPEFIVMTEGLCDAELNSVYYFHGYENGVYVPLQEEFSARLDGTAPTFIFPEMFKYTFPEVLTTTRNPAPVNNRLILNYATVYGLRQELESRYAADVRYLKENRIPVLDDYSNVISKPDLDLVRSEDPVASRIYTRQVIDFQRENFDLLWKGKFVDEKGFTIQACTTIVAKAFVSGNRMGIVVWNTGSQDEQFTLKVPGYTFEYATEPGKINVNPYDKLPAEHIRLLIWKK
ncbi:MAG: hypothetical protein A2W90_23005 [Bacteroidetes bacterium GWF2_42_66]|nr:MAG: hypothetical protein A2W92_02815 [Bacteroidetes bacterium GWA2_42_15]OFX99477.1 MAG: hypothetical protein A2W89_12690 [Bacteroidetes bacterium GWE2_42_39]OFY47008.1 MAG: hypothetical protein A2W90_23005 [Bacteroidetes bacterium GWF2_42_66]HBL76835.1 hypothetical protein [Prolixibacteraceae bacterium]HCR88896.1 hypothetical protein [Prolixibacteraceae bacterium]